MSSVSVSDVVHDVRRSRRLAGGDPQSSHSSEPELEGDVSDSSGASNTLTPPVQLRDDVSSASGSDVVVPSVNQANANVDALRLQLAEAEALQRDLIETLSRECENNVEDRLPLEVAVNNGNANSQPRLQAPTGVNPLTLRLPHSDRVFYFQFLL